MVQVKAIFDGEKVVLPSGLQRFGSGEVIVTFPDELIRSESGAPRPIWEVLKDGYTSGRTMDDVDQQMRELRDEWDDEPRDKLRGPPK